MDDLVIGADIGGTSTRVAVCTVTGSVLGVAHGGPGNPTSVGLDGSARQIRRTITDALAEAGVAAGSSERIREVVIGLAGATRAASSADFLRSAVPDGLDVQPRLVSDLTVAFCSATAAWQGYVLVAGTGAVAGNIVGDELRQRRDGWGWLLGDDGSGFWLGRSAVRATLAALERDEPLGPMSRAVLDETGTTDHLDLLRACYAQPPTWLASFAVLVTRHAAADPAAAAIAADAGRQLCESVLSLDPLPPQPIVLAGSVLARPGPVSDAVSTRLGAAVANPVLRAESGLAGALWVGLRHRHVDSAALHANLVGRVGTSA